MSTTNNVTWLTQEAFDRLQSELDHLKGEGRSDIASKIEAARSEGDLKENGGYHAAREEQAKQEARIQQLTALLRDAQVGEAPPDDGVVEPGMVVTAKVAGEKMVFLLGNREVAVDASIQAFSERSPLGMAIHGKSRGEKTSYVAPNGKTIPVEIIDATPYKA